MALKLSADDMISEMNYGRRRREEPINTMVSVSRRKQGRVEKIGKRRWRRRRLARGLCFKDDSERAWGGLTPCSSQSTSSFFAFFVSNGKAQVKSYESEKHLIAMATGAFGLAKHSRQ